MHGNAFDELILHPQPEMSRLYGFLTINIAMICLIEMAIYGGNDLPKCTKYTNCFRCSQWEMHHSYLNKTQTIIS